MMRVVSKMRYLLWSGLLIAALSGCGRTQASPSSAAAPAPASTRHHKTRHTHQAVRVKGVVTTITPAHILVKTSSGTVWTFVVSSHTHYRRKKVAIKFSAIVPGSIVWVLARHQSSRDIARVIRLL